MDKNTSNYYKTFIANVIENSIKSLDKQIAACQKKSEDDFENYFVVYLKTHVKTVMKRKQIFQLYEWIKMEEDETKIKELLQSGIDFMTNKLLQYNFIQSSNELFNLNESYRLETYSDLIPIYKSWYNHK